MILIDVAARYKMYAADVARGVVFAGTKEQEKIMEVAVTAFEAGLKSVKFGVRASDIYAVVREVIDKAGYGEYFKESAGHGIGMDPEDEVPFIVARNEMIIQPNSDGLCFWNSKSFPFPNGIGPVSEVFLCMIYFEITPTGVYS